MQNNELQNQYELLCEKITRLREKLAFETDVSVKFKLENQIEEAEEELSKLENRIEFIETDKITLSLKGKSNLIHCVFANQVTFGRAPICDFSVYENSTFNSVSNLHALISFDNKKNEYWIEDLKSINGTFINKKKIEKRTQIHWGDKLSIGPDLSLEFEYDQNDTLSSGIFIRYDNNGTEIERFIVAPKGKLRIGTNSNEAVRFPVFREQHSLGFIERKIDGIYLLDADGSEKKLENNTELTIDVFKVGVLLLNIVEKDTLEPTQNITLTQNHQEKLAEWQELEEIKRPPEESVPSYIWKFNIASAFIIVLTGILGFVSFKPDVNKIAYRWVAECVAALEQGEKKFWRLNSNWPPQDPLSIVLLKTSDHSVEDYLIEQLNITDDDKYYLNYGEFSARFINSQPKNLWLAIEKTQSPSHLHLRVTFWTPQMLGIPAFEWEKSKFLYWHVVFALIVITFLCGATRHKIIERYRNTLDKRYENLQKKRTTKIFEAKSRLDEARTLVQKDELAKALIITNDLLASVPRSIPVHSEVLDLKKIISARTQNASGAITLSPLYKPGSNHFSSSQNQLKLLFLRILGTPYAYQAPYGLEEISVGRQRRKKDGPLSVGNDVIIRVPGSDQKSRRISRRHLEIKRINTEYFVIDKSGGRTNLNGQKLLQDQPYQLQSGDRLSIANVLVLEVLIRVKLVGIKANNLIRINPENLHKDELLIEASIGDMLTEVSYE